MFSQFCSVQNDIYVLRKPHIYPISQKPPHLPHLSENPTSTPSLRKPHIYPISQKTPSTPSLRKPHIYPISQKFPKWHFWNDSNVHLIDDGPLLSFQCFLISWTSYNVQTANPRPCIQHCINRPHSRCFAISRMRIQFFWDSHDQNQHVTRHGRYD